MSEKKAPDLPAVELNHDGKYGSGSGTIVYYKVQARTSSPAPTVYGGIIIDNAWRDLPITRGATKWGINIPVGAMFGADALDHGLNMP